MTSPWPDWAEIHRFYSMLLDLPDYQRYAEGMLRLLPHVIRSSADTGWMPDNCQHALSLRKPGHQVSIKIQHLAGEEFCIFLGLPAGMNGALHNCCTQYAIFEGRLIEGTLASYIRIAEALG